MMSVRVGVMMITSDRARFRVGVAVTVMAMNTARIRNRITARVRVELRIGRG